MEPDLKSHPILSYVMSRKALSESLIGGSELPVNASDTVLSIDAEADKKEGDEELIVNQMPNLKRPEVLAAMTAAITDVVQARAVIQGLGECPDHEAVDLARSKIAEIESNLSKQLEDIVSAPRSESVDRLEWRVLQAEKEEQARQAAEREKFPFKAVIQLYEMHEAYEDSLKEAEQRLVKIYESVDNCSEVLPVKDEVNEEVVIVLKEASQKNLEKVELRGQMLRFLPEDFGKLSTLILLDLSNNQLEVLPDSIAGLTNLQQLYLSSNLLVSLPDSIGFLKSLRVLNVSGNKLKALPDSISRCSALIELDASFNQLTYLPTGIGHELVNLQKLFIHLNKIRSLPSSLCEMQSLRYLDVHFNELKSLPLGIGNLTNLEILNASSNFSDLVSIPDTVGDLINLIELDLSNNQIRELPCSFGRLQKLEKLNLDQNPLVFPPMDIVEQGVEAVKEYMAKKWLEFLLEEEKRSLSEASDMHSQDNWLHRGGSWFGGWFSAVTGSLTGFLGTTNKSHNDDYLEEQL